MQVKPQSIFFIHRYAPYFLHASETDCEEPNIEHKLEIERPQFGDLVAECKEILAGMRKILESMDAKIVTYLEPLVLIETEVEPELKIIENLKSEL